MKKNKIILAALLSTTILAGAVAPVAAATEGGPKDTKGTIKFLEGEDTTGDIEKPGKPEEIIEVPDKDKNNTSGTLRFNFVPNLNFGERQISSKTDVFSPLLQEYTYKDDTAKTKHYIPHFVQVEDVRGKKNATWNVTVKTAKFQKLNNAGAQIPGEALDNTTIAFKQQKLFNSASDDYGTGGWFGGAVTDTEFLQGFQTSSVSSITLSDTAQKLFEAKKSTTGSKSSIVLNETYDPMKTDYTAEDENPGIELTTPAKDIKEVGATYEATITWMLNATP